MIDRLAAYAAREAESEDPEETKKQEEAAARRLAEKVKVQKAKLRANTPAAGSTGLQNVDVDVWSSESQNPTSAPAKDVEDFNQVTQGMGGGVPGNEKSDITVRKFRGVPENVRLFEVFWQQIVELIKVRMHSRV